MKIKEFVANYDLHDSLVEKVEHYNEKLIMSIILCNWRQKNYNSLDDEMKPVKLIFNNVTDVVVDPSNVVFDSDTILEFKYSNKKMNSDSVDIELVIEGEGDIKIINFKSDMVEVL